MPEAPLTAAEAAARLGVKAATLYAYVSRGLLRSEAGPPGTRERRYNAEDIRALEGRQDARRDPQAHAQEAATAALGGALHWGAPILDSALTRIGGGSFAYRGQDAVALAETARAEEVAALLWTGDPQGWPPLPMRARLELGPRARGAQPAEAFAYALTHAGAHDVAALDTRPHALPVQAARVLTLLYAALERHAGLPPAPDLPLHARLARAWAVPAQADLLRRALVLLADHELNISAFTARVAASGGAALPHVTLAALSALQGPAHGLAGLGAHDLLAQVTSSGGVARPGRAAGDARAALSDATRRHAHLPGLGHRLYPDGDPRARALLHALERILPSHPAVGAALAVRQVALEDTGEHPNVDLALAALVLALGRPAGDTLTLFALARAAGWLAHALEARASGQLLRPRARHVGP